MDLARLNLRNAYHDPNLICEACHAGPLLWQNDYPTFKGAKGKAREAISKASYREARNEAALYIGKAFIAHERFQYIEAPYNFG
jgi:hypothetical protein